jgi:hypothetical protein
MYISSPKISSPKIFIVHILFPSILQVNYILRGTPEIRKYFGFPVKGK